MEIFIKHYGNSRTTPSKIIELTCKNYDTQFTIDVTDAKGFVDVNLIENLRQVADELEEQNKMINYENLVCDRCGSSDLEDCGSNEYSCEECGHFPITN